MMDVVVDNFYFVGNYKHTTGFEVMFAQKSDGVYKRLPGFHRLKCNIGDEGEISWEPGYIPPYMKTLMGSINEEQAAIALQMAIDTKTTNPTGWMFAVKSAAEMELVGVCSDDRRNFLKRLTAAFHRWCGQTRRDYSVDALFGNAIAGGPPLGIEPDYDGPF